MTTQPVSATASSDAVADFFAGTTYGDLNADLVERAKRSLLDYIGCAAFGRSASSVAGPLAYFRAQQAIGESTVLFGGGRLPANQAALINGAFVHSTEMSETFTRAVAHPGNSVLPAIMAVAERQHSSGRDVLTAIAVGYEFMIRIGLAVGPQLVMEQGLHAPATVAGFGAAGVSAKLNGADRDGIADAMGIAACNMPSPLIAAMFEHATVKDFYQAFGASLGVLAADFAGVGVTGPSSFIESWSAAIPHHFDLPQVTDRLKDHWWISSGGLHFKLLPVMAMAAPSIGALRKILAGGEPIRVSDIVEIVVASSGRISLGEIPWPTNVLAARGSLPFLMAAGIVEPDLFLKDRFLLSFLDERQLANEEIRQLASMVRLERNEEFHHNLEVAWPMKFEARVTVKMRNGRSVSGYDDIWPETSNLDFSQVGEKFLALSEGVVPPDRTSRLFEAIADLEHLHDFADLVGIVA